MNAFDRQFKAARKLSLDIQSLAMTDTSRNVGNTDGFSNLAQSFQES